MMMRKMRVRVIQLRLRRILKDKDKENKENDHPRLGDTNLVMRMRVMQMGLRWI